ncbi:hypothetical protein OIU84_008575, partial [Salix udensis]
MLEELREARSPTRLWTIVMVPAAQLIRSKCLTPTLTSRNTTGCHGEVETVYKGHSIRGEVVLAVVEGDLCQSGRGSSSEAVAFYSAVAITLWRIGICRWSGCSQCGPRSGLTRAGL